MTDDLKYVLSENEKLKSEYEDLEKHTDTCQNFKEGVINYCNQLKTKLHSFVDIVMKNKI
jgi:hypothetical protein